MRSAAWLSGVLLLLESSETFARVPVTETEISSVRRSDAVLVDVPLCRRGHHPRPERVTMTTMQVLGTVLVDVDGDGDNDALLTVEGTTLSDHGRSITGRGAVLAYNEPSGWRGVTVASTRNIAVSEGYQWGTVEHLRTGAPPLLHLSFAHAGPEGAWQSETLLQHRAGAGLVAVFTAVNRSPGFRFMDTLDVVLSDIDHDGTSEVVERVLRAEVVDNDGEMHPDAPQHLVREQTFRWSESHAAFVIGHSEGGSIASGVRDGNHIAPRVALPR